MPRRLAVSSFLLLLALVTSPLRATAAERPLVPAFERFLAKEPGLEGGLLLLGELNCTSCHAAGEELAGFVDRKRAPILDEVGSRVRLDWMRAFLADPAGTKPGTTMPSVLAAMSERERAESAEALVQFLSTTGSIADLPVEPKLVGEGRKLFHEIGCTACHAPIDGPPVNLATGVPLPAKMHEKYTVTSLTRFLENPLHVRPSGRMPGQKWEQDEAKQVAHYLMRDLEGVAVAELQDRPKVPYRYYEGDWQTLPDLDKLQPKTEGLGPAYDIGLRQRNDRFALVWDAMFETVERGTYTFAVGSDDGSKLWVDGTLVAEHDGIHPYGEKEGSLLLKPGIHTVRVAMFEAAGEERIEAFVSGPGLPRQHLGNIVAANEEALRKGKPEKPEPVEPDDSVFTFDEAKSQRGRELFVSLGCASCHDLKGVKPTLAAKPLAGLPNSGGCLAPDPHAGQPFYALSGPQRKALRDAITIAAGRSWPPVTTTDRIHRTMTRLNCYTCHARSGFGGVEKERDDLFEITQKEMGDEGRLPPPLNGVGVKLTENWLRDYLAKGGNDRPYMKVRMPAFGENAKHLVADLAAADPLREEVVIPTLEGVERRIKADGRHLVGDKVFGCIKCHNFNGIAGTGVQSIDLTILTKRLRHDWFHAYMKNPQAYRPGTRMPGAWPLGQTTVPDILGGTAEGQIEGIWIYLADGTKSKVPAGLERNPIVLVADAEPVVYRNFIEGAGPRAIGVAYPTKSNIAWDANEFTLALIWQGEFIDASKHWLGRGQGFQSPLGDQVVPLETRTPVARLESPHDPWPTTAARERGYHFKGYTYTKDREPVFRYEFADVLVEDHPTGVATQPFPSLNRTLRVASRGISPNVQNVWFRAAVAPEITKDDEGWYSVGNNVRMRFDDEAHPTIVEVNGLQELRVPLTGELTQEIKW